mmetsp:Transcript_9235/g.13688  ORF Transcript_9235/g.13688 Transcript_9235/m.13688 type:complete len:95 (+) Transcript_9235:64-348(+)
MSKKLIPLFDRILVQRIKVESKGQPKSVGGILLPESAAKKSNPLAKVISVNEAVHVKVGDVVMLPEYKGASVVFEGEEYDMYREDEILGTVESL